MALILCFNLISNVKSNCHIKLSQQCVCHTVNYNKNKLINKLNRFFALQIKSTWLLSPSVLQFTSQKTSKRYYMYLITSLRFLMILSNFFKSLSNKFLFLCSYALKGPTHLWEKFFKHINYLYFKWDDLDAKNIKCIHCATKLDLVSR